MNSEQTEKSNQGKNQIPNDWMPASVTRKRKSSEPMNEEMEAEFQKILQEGFLDESSPKPDVSDDSKNNIATGTAVQQNEKNGTEYSLQSQNPEPAVSTESKEQPVPTVASKRTTSKQRKESLEEYRQTFLTVPKLEDRKPVFISCEVRDRIDRIIHQLGGRGRSVSMEIRTMINTIFFDLDGVIIDSESIHAKAKRMILDSHSIQYPDSIFDDFIGQPDEVFFKHVYENLDKQRNTYKLLLQEKNDQFFALIPEMQLVEGFISFINEIKKRNIKTALVSSTSTY